MSGKPPNHKVEKLGHQELVSLSWLVSLVVPQFDNDSVNFCPLLIHYFFEAVSLVVIKIAIGIVPGEAGIKVSVFCYF